MPPVTMTGIRTACRMTAASSPNQPGDWMNGWKYRYFGPPDRSRKEAPHSCIRRAAPVIAGIMPVTNAKQIKRITQMSGTYLPSRFMSIVDRFGDHPAAMKQAGIAYATDQIIDLIANGVNGIHIYSMNKPDVAGKIKENLSEILGNEYTCTP